MLRQVATMDDMGKMAQALVKSKLFGFETIEQAMSIMLIAQAEGRSPALAARDYHVIKGRPALKADAMLARFQQEGGVVQWDEYTDAKVTGAFSHPKSCPKPVSVTWTIDMAKRIGLATRDNWRNYPRAMLRARVISEGVRTAYPGIAVGLYTVEEVHDLAPEKDITPNAGAGESLTEQRRAEISELADKVREWLNQGSLTDAYGEVDNAGLDVDEYNFLWSHFDSRIRRQLKEEGERQRLKATAKQLPNADVITDAQKKRLEARIGELKLNRDGVKEWMVENLKKEHLSELTKDEYDTLDSKLDSMQPKAAPHQASTSASRGAELPPVINPDEGAAPMTEEKAIENISKAIDAETLALAADMAKSIVKSAPSKLAAGAAYRKRLGELKAMANEVSQ